ncbi:hypothetical protein GGX14DRAFT_571841 [Mycena pura]|uniref:Uncharacterized protein n=1 Tax=Mycena pura TaxID=153505 RepID=A0AAD6Y4F4_9AGAR|nr:hypothetical protein GGX14DRAFT_571841 [Mycena pura]
MRICRFSGKIRLPVTVFGYIIVWMPLYITFKILQLFISSGQFSTPLEGKGKFLVTAATALVPVEHGVVTGVLIHSPLPTKDEEELQLPESPERHRTDNVPNPRRPSHAAANTNFTPVVFFSFYIVHGKLVSNMLNTSLNGRNLGDTQASRSEAHGLHFAARNQKNSRRLMTSACRRVSSSRPSWGQRRYDEHHFNFALAQDIRDFHSVHRARSLPYSPAVPVYTVSQGEHDVNIIRQSSALRSKKGCIEISQAIAEIEQKLSVNAAVPVVAAWLTFVRKADVAKMACIEQSPPRCDTSQRLLRTLAQARRRIIASPRGLFNDAAAAGKRAGWDAGAPRGAEPERGDRPAAVAVHFGLRRASRCKEKAEPRVRTDAWGGHVCQ